MTEPGPPGADALPPADEPRPVAATADRLSEERPHPLTPVVQVWIWLVGAALFLGRSIVERGGDLATATDFARLPGWLIVVLAVTGFSIVTNLWRWWTTRFVVTDQELRVEHRGVQHESRRIAYQRIQSVDVIQPFAARLLGLAQLTIDVGAGRPTKLQYLSRPRANGLRDELLIRASGASARDAHVQDDLSAARLLITVPPRELLLGAALSHELLALLVASGVPLAIGIAVGEPALVGGGVLPLLVSAAGFLSKRVVGQFNYALTDTPGGLRITRGLATLSSETLPVQRVQAIRIHEPVLWRRIGRARVDLTFLGLSHLTTDEDSAGASSILLPIGRPDAVAAALHAVWPGLRLDAIPLTPAPAAARLLAPLALPWIAYGWDDRVVVFRRGWWTRTTWIMPHARLQSAQASQDALERLLGIATVGVHTTELGSVPTTLMTDADARAFVFEEMARAATARTDELTSAPETHREGRGVPADEPEPRSHHSPT